MVMRKLEVRFVPYPQYRITGKLVNNILPRHLDYYNVEASPRRRLRLYTVKSILYSVFYCDSFTTSLNSCIHTGLAFPSRIRQRAPFRHLAAPSTIELASHGNSR